MRTNVTRTLVVAVGMLAVVPLIVHDLVLGAPAAPIARAAPSGALVAAVRLDPPDQPAPALSPEVREIVDLAERRTSSGRPRSDEL